MTLSDRMKSYEVQVDTSLIEKQPVIIRIDGKAFHTFTKELDKPFDVNLSEAFIYTCAKLKSEIDGVKLIYSQSDEISLLLMDTDKPTTTSWFHYRIQKMTSVAASLATLYFNEYIFKICNSVPVNYNNESSEISNIWLSKLFKANFDARVFNLPANEVCNYFIYRQSDAIRNAKQALAQAYYSQKEISNKTGEDQVNMMRCEHNIDFYSLPLIQQRGFCIYKKDNANRVFVDKEIPLFKDNREYVDKYL